jgi:hypothetical protein
VPGVLDVDALDEVVAVSSRDGVADKIGGVILTSPKTP